MTISPWAPTAGAGGLRNVHVEETHVDNGIPRPGGQELGNRLREPSTKSPGANVGHGRAIRAAQEGGLVLRNMGAQSIARFHRPRPVIENIRRG